jgi:hypothetical protein
MWVEKEFPVVPGLDAAPPHIARRFWSIRLDELITDRWSYFQKTFSEEVEKIYGELSMETAMAFVIERFQYPLYLGAVPTDWHTLGGYRLWPLPPLQSIHVPVDYWRTAAESMLFYVNSGRGYGDCEDVSILLGAAMKLLNIGYFVCLGIVYRGTTPLGGHAWAIVRYPDDGTWHLVECTLDVFPGIEAFPEIDPDDHVWTVGDLRYEAMARFSHIKYEEWISTTNAFSRYIGIDPKAKRSRRKIKAIRKTWSRLVW